MKKFYGSFMDVKFGPLDKKVDLQPDFFTGFDPKRRAEITKKEAAFYHSITSPYSVEDKLLKNDFTVSVSDGTKIPVREYRPRSAKGVLPAFIFVHGGGFITCTIETHDFVPSYVAVHADCICYSIGYRLAPEFPFPQGLQDCFDVALWIKEHASKLGIDGQRISIGGDSSGGNFAAVLAQMGRDTGKLQFSSQILVYPVTDMSGTVPKESESAYAHADINKKPDPDFLHMYLSDSVDRTNFRVSPLLAKDLEHLPKALFILAECDSLCSDGLYYAKALKDSGVEVAVDVYRGMPHAFLLRTYSETFDALDRISNYITRN
jgi:acetyl esterase